MYKTFFKKKSLKSSFIIKKKRVLSRKSFFQKTIKDYYFKKRKEKLKILEKFLSKVFLKNEKKDLTHLYFEKNYLFNKILAKKDEKITNLRLLVKGEILVSKRYIISEKKKNFPNCLQKIKKFSNKNKIINKNICFLKKGFFLGFDEILKNEQFFKYDFKVISDEAIFYEISIENFLKNIFLEENKNLLKKKSKNFSDFIFISEKKISDRINKHEGNNFENFDNKNFDEILNKKDNFKIKTKFQKYNFLQKNLKYHNSKSPSLIKKINKSTGNIKNDYYLKNKNHLLNKKAKSQKKINLSIKFSERNNFKEKKKKRSIKILEQNLSKDNLVEHKIIDNQKVFNFIENLRHNYKSYIINVKKKQLEKIERKKKQKNEKNNFKINIDKFRNSKQKFYSENVKNKVFSCILEKSYKLNKCKSRLNFIIKNINKI